MFKFNRKAFQKQQGFVLLMPIVALGVLGIMIYSINSQVSSIFKSQKFAETFADRIDLENYLISTLDCQKSLPNGCEGMHIALIDSEGNNILQIGKSPYRVNGSCHLKPDSDKMNLVIKAVKDDSQFHLFRLTKSPCVDA